MIKITKEGILLEKTLLDFENEGVLNPATIKEGNSIHLFYRAVSKGNYSGIGYCRLNNPLNIERRDTAPILKSEYLYESQGIEDPRIVKIEDCYYLTYTAYDGNNALGALAISKDLITWEKKGIIVPQITYTEFSNLAEAKGKINIKYLRYNERKTVFVPNDTKVLIWDKNVVFFPRKINGKFSFLHRIKPDIQIVAFTEFEELTPEFWQNHLLHLEENIVISSKYEHELSYLGGGCPPIETEQGWLLIYHGVADSINGYVYSACAALLDLENPAKEIARLPYPLFSPEYPWELRGEVNNVCFPSGTVLLEDILYIYYGAADERIACASVKLSELLNELNLNKRP